MKNLTLVSFDKLQGRMLLVVGLYILVGIHDYVRCTPSGNIYNRLCDHPNPNHFLHMGAQIWHI